MAQKKQIPAKNRHDTDFPRYFSEENGLKNNAESDDLICSDNIREIDRGDCFNKRVNPSEDSPRKIGQHEYSIRENYSTKLDTAENINTSNEFNWRTNSSTPKSSDILRNTLDTTQTINPLKRFMPSTKQNLNRSVFKFEPLKLPKEFELPSIQPIPKINPRTFPVLKAGYAIVINNNTFDDPKRPERLGSDVDVKNIKDVLEMFQIPYEILQDGNMSQIKNKMAQLQEFDFADYESIMLFIMSHGCENNVLAAKDGSYSLNTDVLYPLLRNSSLIEKLKLFFVQSCKGLTDLRFLDDSGSSEGPTKTPKHILQLFSTVEGYKAFRTPEDGSIFVDILCKKLKQLGKTMDILEISFQVISAVVKEFPNMQIPIVYTNLTKKFVLGDYIR